MKTIMYVIENADDSKTIIEGATVDISDVNIRVLDIFAKAKAMKRQILIDHYNEYNILDNVKLNLK